MIRLPTARQMPAGPTTILVFLLLALLALSGCGGGSMAKEAAAPASPSGAYGGDADYRAETTGASAGAPMEPEAAAPASETAVLEDEEVSREIPERRPVARNAPPAPAPPPSGGGGRGPATKKADAATTPPARPQQHGVDTGSARPPEAAAIASPLLIYRANLTMAVFETKKAADKTEQIARDAGGYLVRRDDRSITVRVPAARFHGALATMMKLGDVLHRDVSVEDVTAQYRDLQIRLKNAEAVRDRLAALLKKAQSVKDALQVERELARVTDEIERMKGKLKLLHELVQFSTITITFSPQSVEHVDSTVTLPFPWLGDLGLGKLLRL